MTSAVYLLKKAGNVVYVGQSRDVNKRLGEHRLNKVDFDEHQIIETAPADLKKLEQEYILKHQPALNGWTNRYGGRAFFDSSGTARSAAERQREFRARMKALGYEKFEFYGTAEECRKVKRWANWLLRKHLADPNYDCFLKPERE